MGKITDYINSAKSSEDRAMRKQQLFFLLYGSTNPNKSVMPEKLTEGKPASTDTFKRQDK